MGDTTQTKIFVGGLAWETQRDTLGRYFEQFGEILEAVVITDKNTGRSKGYGFVTFKDADSAMRACEDPSPMIDGRRANCNLASLGAQKSRPQASPSIVGTERGRPPAASWSMAPPSSYRGTPTYTHQPSPRIPLPYSAYGYSGYYQQDAQAMNHYNVYGGQQMPSFYPPSAASGAPGLFYNYYPPFYAQYGNYPPHQPLQYYLPQQRSRGVGAFTPINPPVASPSVAAASPARAATVTVAASTVAGSAAGSGSDHNNSSA